MSKTKTITRISEDVIEIKICSSIYVKISDLKKQRNSLLFARNKINNIRENMMEDQLGNVMFLEEPDESEILRIIAKINYYESLDINGG